MHWKALRHKESTSSPLRAAEMCAAAADADVVLAESPVNPTLDVVDLHRLATTCRGRGVTLVVDNTTADAASGSNHFPLAPIWWSPAQPRCSPGHSDVVAGYVAGSLPELMADVERERLLAGAILGPFEAWLTLRSLGSAGLRFERQCHNAMAVALMLRGHPSVKVGAVSGPAGRSGARRRAPSHEAVRLARRRRTRRRRRGAPFGRAQRSVGRRHQLRRHPHLSWTGGHGGATRLPDGFARISLGIEDTDDLLTDIERALA